MRSLTSRDLRARILSPRIIGLILVIALHFVFFRSVDSLLPDMKATVKPVWTSLIGFVSSAPVDLPTGKVAVVKKNELSSDVPPKVRPPQKETLTSAKERVNIPRNEVPERVSLPVLVGGESSGQDQLPVLPSELKQTPVELGPKASGSETSTAVDSLPSQEGANVAASSAVVLPIRLPPDRVLAEFNVIDATVENGPYLGRVRLELEQSDGTYIARFFTKFNWATRLLIDNRQWVSQGGVNASGFVPQVMTESRGRRDPRRYVVANTNQDRLSVIWQLTSVTRAAGLKFWDLNPELQVKVPMQFPSRQLEALWVGRVERDGEGRAQVHWQRKDEFVGDLNFEFWLGDEQLLPIRLQLSDGKGRKLELQRAI